MRKEEAMSRMTMKTIALTGLLVLVAPLAARADVTKRDVQGMLRAQFSCQNILQYIRSNAPVLPLSSQDLVDLRAEGADEQVIQALLQYTPSGIPPACTVVVPSPTVVVPPCPPVQVDLGCDDPGFACDPGCDPVPGCAPAIVYPAWHGEWGGDYRGRALDGAPRDFGRPWDNRGRVQPVAPRVGPARPGIVREPRIASPAARALPAAPRPAQTVIHPAVAQPRPAARPAPRAPRPAPRAASAPRQVARPAQHAGGGRPAAHGGSSSGGKHR